jgi:diadenosine tetraphosphatase ApaH/serine/threonine PP2A family protein phosphatase
LPVAVITDIHSNLPALETVLADIEAREIDRIWCLGDVVGYGADPDACADLVRERCELCLVGNHDLAVLEALDIAAFSDAAAEAVVWTQEKVEQRTLDFLGELEPAGSRDGIGLFHASPRDPVWEYVLSLEQAYACIAEQPEPVTLIGHSHVSLFFTQPEGGGSPSDTVGSQAGGGTRLELSHGGRWLVNPGSVGQPRDGDPEAAWLELDTESLVAVFHRLPYDIDRAAAAIVDGGLPKRLADRLYVGQ